MAHMCPYYFILTHQLCPTHHSPLIFYPRSLLPVPYDQHLHNFSYKSLKVKMHECTVWYTTPVTVKSFIRLELCHHKTVTLFRILPVSLASLSSVKIFATKPSPFIQLKFCSSRPLLVKMPALSCPLENQKISKL